MSMRTARWSVERRRNCIVEGWRQASETSTDVEHFPPLRMGTRPPNMLAVYGLRMRPALPTQPGAAASAAAHRPNHRQPVKSSVGDGFRIRPTLPATHTPGRLATPASAASKAISQRLQRARGPMRVRSAGAHRTGL